MKRPYKSSTPAVIIMGLVTTVLLLTGCEKEIQPSLPTDDPVLVVEAWLTNRFEKQTIQLTQTQPYFSNQLPVGITRATVKVTNDYGQVFDFVSDGTKNGNYVWVPSVPGEIGGIGSIYTLTVVVNGETFTAVTKMNRVPPIDSVTFKVQQDFQFPDGSAIAEFWATDLPGKGDTYWIRSYKNGELLSKPSEINLAYDAGFSAGGDFDNTTFISPIRRAINPVDQDANKKMLPPFVSGDSVYVEIQSITLAAFDHMTQVKIQTDRPGGFGELFATPLANVSSNIKNTDASGSKVVGFFNVAAVSGAGKKLK